MTREQIINKIYDKIRDDLLHALLLYWEEDDANKYPLVDHLSSGNDISTGRDEIDNLIEQIEIEPLIDAILALPLDEITAIQSHCKINMRIHRDYWLREELSDLVRGEHKGKYFAYKYISDGIRNGFFEPKTDE